MYDYTNVWYTEVFQRTNGFCINEPEFVLNLSVHKALFFFQGKLRAVFKIPTGSPAAPSSPSLPAGPGSP